MVAQHFRHVETWVFDLDNTLYPPSARLFDQIEVRMTAWVMQALGGRPGTRPTACAHHYWHTYGTTLAGLMREHGVDPGPYLTDVHDISFDALTPDPALAARDRRPAGPPDRLHQRLRPLCRTGAGRARSYRASSMRSTAWNMPISTPSPTGRPSRRSSPSTASTPARAAMFEDDPRNLAVPHAMGMRTVHVAPEAARRARTSTTTPPTCRTSSRQLA